MAKVKTQDTSVSDETEELSVSSTDVAKPSTSTEVALPSAFAGSFLAQAKSQTKITSPFKQLNIVQDNGYSEELEDGAVEVPFGNFHIRGTKLYGKELTLRPIITYNKILKRAGEEDKYKVLGETIFFRPLVDKESRIDTLGTVDCGRLFGKATKEMSPADLKLEKAKATWYTYIFGMATIDGSDQELVVLRIGGGKSVRWSEASDQKVIKSKPNQRQFTLKLVLPKDDPLLTPLERKDARNTSVNLVVAPDMSRLLPLEDLAEAGDMLLEYIYRHNNDIKEKHFEAIRQRQLNGYVDDDGTLDVEYEVVSD